MEPAGSCWNVNGMALGHHIRIRLRQEVMAVIFVVSILLESALTLEVRRALAEDLRLDVFRCVVFEHEDV